MKEDDENSITPEEEEDELKESLREQPEYDAEEFQEYDAEELFPQFKTVAGYKEDEYRPEELNNRESYTNWEINEHLGSYFRFFGKNDMDIIYLYFLSKKRQEDIMTILGKSQPAVSYDVTRIKEQIQFVVRVMAMIDEFIIFITDPANKMKTEDKEMLTIFLYSTSIVKTSRILGSSNITCRSHLNTLVNRLKANGHIRMYELFKYILDNLNHIKKTNAQTRIGGEQE